MIRGNAVIFVLNKEFLVLIKLFLKIHGPYGRILAAYVLWLVRKAQKPYVPLLYAARWYGQVSPYQLAFFEALVIYPYGSAHPYVYAEAAALRHYVHRPVQRAYSLRRLVLSLRGSGIAHMGAPCIFRICLEQGGMEAPEIPALMIHEYPAYPVYILKLVELLLGKVGDIPAYARKRRFKGIRIVFREAFDYLLLNAHTRGKRRSGPGVVQPQVYKPYRLVKLAGGLKHCNILRQADAQIAYIVVWVHHSSLKHAAYGYNAVCKVLPVIRVAGGKAVYHHAVASCLACRVYIAALA